MAETILIGEDEAVQRKMLAMVLSKRLGYKTLEAENGLEVVKMVRDSGLNDISAVVMDLEMPQMNGLEALEKLRKFRPDLPVLMLTARDDTSAAVAAIKKGASDFIVKPADPAQLDVALKNAIRFSTLSRELTRLKRDKAGALGFQDIIGFDAGLAAPVDYARKAAACDIPVMMSGEVSTGKELLARAIHGESRRMGAPFVAVQCDATSGLPIETVLFGQEKSDRFSAARIPGKVREAERGTLFLDDVHALTPDAQVKLLHLLQQREIEPTGAERPVRVNVRVISATDRDMKKLVAEGSFREDLYFRINVLTITMPSLRERQKDVLMLADYFLQRLSAQDALPYKPLAVDAEQYIRDYAWPGNMRELEGLMHRALVLCEGKKISRALLLEIHAADDSTVPGDLQLGQHIAMKKANGLPKTMAEIEAEAMQKSLIEYGNNITRASESLGIAKSTFYRKLKEQEELR